MRSLLTSRWFGAEVMPRDALPRKARVAGGVFLSIAALVLIAPVQAQPPAYVSSGNNVVVIDTATNTVEGAIGPLLEGGSRPAAVSPDGAFLYVPSGGPLGVVSVIDVATNSVDAVVEVGAIPVAVALTSDGAFAYVVNQASNTVSVINTATNALDATVNVGDMPSAIAITPEGAFAYVTNHGTGTVSVIDTSMNIVAAVVPVGLTPIDLAITPDGSQVYVVSQQGMLSVIDTATSTAAPPVPVAPSLKSIAISPDGALAYVSASLFPPMIFVIDTTTNTLITGFDAGACDIALTPDGASIYAAHGGSTGVVDVVDTATLSHTSISGVGGCGITIPHVMAPSPSGVEAIIDIKPDSINPKSNQKIQVTVFTTDDFDALQVNPGTVSFGPGAAPLFRHHAKDVNGDGNVDAVFHFETRATGLACGDTEATFTGKTYDGEEVTGKDSIGMAPCADVAGAAARGSASKTPGRGRGPRNDRL